MAELCFHRYCSTVSPYYVACIMPVKNLHQQKYQSQVLKPGLRHQQAEDLSNENMNQLQISLAVSVVEEHIIGTTYAVNAR